MIHRPDTPAPARLAGGIPALVDIFQGLLENKLIA
jgi:hypothetical protein